VYAANKNKEEYRLGVALPDDPEAELEYLAIDVTKETLEVMTCPTGNTNTQFRSMVEKGQTWID
jgi:hypothetical protein